jgi:integrase
MARKRRGRGEGGVYQRSDRYWVATVSLGYNGEGKRCRRTIYGKTKQEAQAKLRALQQLADRGQIVDSPDVTLASYLQTWLAGIKGTVSDGTHTYYSDHVRLHITPRIGGTKLRSLSAAIVQAFYGRMAEDGVSVALRQKVGVTLGVALAEAVRMQLIVANPVRDVRKPRPDRQEMTALTAEQLRTFLEAAASDRLFALYAIALDSGARQGELFGLQWQDVDFDAACLFVRRALRERKGVLSLGPPKTAQSRRRIDLSQYSLAALNEHRVRMLADGHCRPDAPVFCDTNGSWLRKSNVTRRSFQPIVQRAGLPSVRFHDLRHTVASLLLSAGEGVKVVSERLGHANSAMTLNIYAHAAPGAQARAAARMDGIFRPPAEAKKLG